MQTDPNDLRKAHCATLDDDDVVRRDTQLQHSRGKPEFISGHVDQTVNVGTCMSEAAPVVIATLRPATPADALAHPHVAHTWMCST